MSIPVELPRVEVSLPFDGFYQTHYSDAADSEVEQWEDLIRDAARDRGETLSAEEVQAITDKRLATYDHKAYAQAVGELVTGKIQEYLKEICIDLDLQFKEVLVARDHSVARDLLIATVSDEAAEGLSEWASKLTDNADFMAVVKARHSSYEGFHSFISDNPDDWSGWDRRHHSLHTYHTTIMGMISVVRGVTEREFNDHIVDQCNHISELGVIASEAYTGDDW